MEEENKIIEKKAKGKKLPALTKEMSFAEISALSKKKLKKIAKKDSLEQNANAKWLQLVAIISEKNTIISNLEKELFASYTDPVADSVKLTMELELVKKHRDTAMSILKQLFPDRYLVMFKD